ncbi:unnamed protein product [Schistosoma rodhaini]|uniref:Uncharacterized protein n=1 Tax=Schistosoma rodhaini TaxID=6188 RepID=A0AA85FSW4_9TREM|nr:unnamed protein product [Schistosoma rodhaini]CAH8563135.1 unnamed protein product [Schistosoma rodhaini]
MNYHFTMTTYLACDNDNKYPNSDDHILQDSDRTNQYENINSDHIFVDLNGNKQGISLEKSIFKESCNTMGKSSNGCIPELQNSVQNYKPSTEMHPFDESDNYLRNDVQSLFQRHSQIVQRLEQLDKQLLTLLHEEWSITGNVPSDYESLSMKLGIYNKPVKNTSYPLSHVLVHKASTVSMKQEYYEYLKKKKKSLTIATNKLTENASVEFESTKINSEIDDFSLPDDEIIKRHQNTTQRLVEVFGRSVSTELLLPNEKLYNVIDLTDRCSNSNTSSIHHYNSGNSTFDKHQYYKLKTDIYLTPSEYYRLNHVTSISDYSSFLSADYSPTTSLRSDHRSIKNNVNNNNDNQDIISNFPSNLSSNINCLNHSGKNIGNLQDEKCISDLRLRNSVNKDLVENNEATQMKVESQINGDVYNEEEEDIDRVAYEIELRRLEVDFAVISQLYAVHKQRAKETKFESYKIAYKSNSKKLKDITQQMNRIKDILLSNQQPNKNQPVISVDRKIIQNQLLKRRRTWNPLKLSSSNWTIGSGTSPRRSKLNEIKFHGFSTPVTPNTTTKIPDNCLERKNDIFIEVPESTIIGRRMQHTLPRHSKLCYEESFKCEKLIAECPVKQVIDEYLHPDPLTTMSVTPIKQDITTEPKPTLSNSVLYPVVTSYVTALNKSFHHSSDSNTINPPTLISAAVQDKLTSPDHTVHKTVVHDRRRKYVKTSKRSHSLSSELFIVSVDDTYNLPHSLLNKIARVRSLPQFNNNQNCSSEYIDNIKKKIAHESYSIDGKLKNLKRQPLSVTTQSSGIGFNNSFASVEYTDTLRSSNLNCVKNMPKNTTSSNTSSSNWSTSGCSCLSSQTNNSSPYEERALKINEDLCNENKEKPKPKTTGSDDYSNTPAKNCSEETTENKVILRHIDKRGRRVPTTLMENINALPFGIAVSARCICSCFSEHSHPIATAESHVCQCCHTDNPINTNTSIPLNKSDFRTVNDFSTAHDEGNLASMPSSICYSEETQSVNTSSDDRLLSKIHLNCYSLQTPKSYDKSQENEERLISQTSNNKSTILVNSKSALKGRLSLKPFSLLRRAVSKVTTSSGRRSLNANTPFTINKKKCITSPAILPSLTTERLKEINTSSFTNNNIDPCRRSKCSFNEIHGSSGYQSNSSIYTTTNNSHNNSNVRQFTWAKKLRHSIRPSHALSNKCVN